MRAVYLYEFTQRRGQLFECLTFDYQVGSGVLPLSQDFGDLMDESFGWEVIDIVDDHLRDLRGGA